MNLIAPDKAARMAAIQNYLLPVLGIVSREDTKPQKIRTKRNPASNIEFSHPPGL
jgi:hypothetical protein